MYLSERERDRRFEKLRASLTREKMDALLVVGNQNMGGSTETGSFRYLTDYFMWARYGMFLFFREGAPILLVGMDSQNLWARRYSWIEDVRTSFNYSETIISLLEEKKLSKGKVGIVGMDSFPASLYLALIERFPKAEFLDATPILINLRLEKGEEERQLMERAAQIDDQAYVELLKYLRPGMKEYEVTGILEGYQRQNGADKTFNLISTSPFPKGPDGTRFQYLPGFPGDRQIQKGDGVVLEITAAYGGYWNQLIRVVSVGGKSPRLVQLQEAVVKVMQAGLAAMQAGKKTEDFLHPMRAAARKEGFEFTPPSGHYVGLSLMDAGAGFDEVQGQVVLAPGTALILHPAVRDPEGIQIFWGQTYFMTERGPVPLNRTDDILVSI
jgi:Xaa-Pro aminopeptidase